MNRKLSLLCLLLPTIATGFAKGTNTTLAVKNIPEELKKNAHAVIRYDKTETIVKALDEVVYKHTYAVTILDEKGRRYGVLNETYNTMVKINDMEGRLYDAEGKELHSLKEKEVSDISTFGQTYAYHSDSRRKLYDFGHTTYPYTVEYSIVQTFKTTFFLPDWQAQPDNNCAVDSAEFILVYPAETAIRYREYLMPADLVKVSGKSSKGMEQITWKLKHIPAYERQPYSRTGNYDQATVVLSPSRFELLKYKGNMQSWNSLGAFFYELNKDRDELPEDKKAQIRAMVSNEKSTYDKVNKLYTYMQQSTRYVANEYGISGWQTFDAESVAKNGYGDCKGLTNYLKAMLKEVGINSYAALVSAGDDHYQIDEDFPSNTFNHVILCIPQAGDSIWVECTSQQLPAGYLGSFTQDRRVLLTTETGGYLCNTPAYNKNKSYIHRNARFRLDTDARQQQIKLQNTYFGLMQDDIGYYLKTQPDEKIKEMVNTKFPFPSYSVATYDYKHKGDGHLPAIEENVEARVAGIVSSTQKRTFLNLGWMRNPMPEIFQTEPRTAPFILRESFSITDTIMIDLPPGTEIETMPKALSMKYPFAEYHIHFEKKDNQVSLIREYEQNKGVYDAAAFEEYQKLYHTINTEKSNLSLVLLN